MKLTTFVIAGLLAGSAGGASAQGLDDAQIASIVVTANQVDIDAGTLAASMASNAEVRKFGQQMVTDHTGVNKQATELVTKLKVTPQDNATSQSLKSGGDANVASLKKLKGAAFDKAYVDHEVAITSRCSMPSTRRSSPARSTGAEGAAWQGSPGLRGASRARQGAPGLPRE